MHQSLFFLFIASAVLALPLAQQSKEQQDQDAQQGWSPEQIAGTGLATFAVGTRAKQAYESYQARLRAKANAASNPLPAEPLSPGMISRYASAEVIHHELVLLKKRWDKDEKKKFKACMNEQDDPLQPFRTTLQKQVDCANKIIAEQALAPVKSTAQSPAPATSDEGAKQKKGSATKKKGSATEKQGKFKSQSVKGSSMAFGPTQGVSSPFSLPHGLPGNLVVPSLAGVSAASVMSKIPNVAAGLGSLWEAGMSALSGLKFIGNAI